jgi:hypothetical protein
MNLRKIFLNWESLIFIVSQLTVGLLNYLYQLHASRTLSIVEFGAWSQWLAQFSVACFAGVWLQSLTTITGLETWLPLRKSRILLFALILALGFSAFARQTALVSFLGWMGNLINGFWFGYHLRTRQMKLIAGATVFGNFFKFLWVHFDPTPAGFTHGTAITAALVCFLFLSFSDSRKFENSSSHKFTWQLMLASLCLAFFSTWVPQVDLLVAPHLVSDVDLGHLAKVALLSKGFYFAFQVLAQILLAHQVQPGGQSLRVHHFLLLGGLGVLAAGAGSALGAYLQWPLPWVVFSLLHVTSLCLLYLCIQDLCAHHRGNWALVLCLTSMSLALVGSWWVPSMTFYWVLCLGIEFVAICAHALGWFEKQDLNNPPSYDRI